MTALHGQLIRPEHLIRRQQRPPPAQPVDQAGIERRNRSES
jgi:hypothetical protein